ARAGAWAAEGERPEAGGSRPGAGAVAGSPGRSTWWLDREVGSGRPPACRRPVTDAGTSRATRGPAAPDGGARSSGTSRRAERASDAFTIRSARQPVNQSGSQSNGNGSNSGQTGAAANGEPAEGDQAGGERARQLGALRQRYL